MNQPDWRLVRKLKIPAQPAAGAFWTPVLDVVQGPRLVRILIVGTQPVNWNPSPIETCSPNGVFDGKAGHLAPDAARGALIGKLGGSASDLPWGDPPKYAEARVFPVGDHAVIKISKDEIAPLYLTMNDTPAGFRQHSGELEIELAELDL